MQTLLAEGKRSAKQFLASNHIYFSIRFHTTDFFVFGDPCQSKIFKITMRYAGKTCRFDFPTSIDSESIPTAQHVLSMVCSRYPGSFEEFSENGGYDTSNKEDRLKVKAIWYCLYLQYEQLCNLFPEHIFKQLQQIQE